MKTYIITINTESAHIVHEAKARNIVAATIKAVLKFRHLGAKLNNVESAKQA